MRVPVALVVLAMSVPASADGPISAPPQPAPEALREGDFYRPVTPGHHFRPWTTIDSCGAPTLVVPEGGPVRCGYMRAGFLRGWSTGDVRIVATVEPPPRGRTTIRRWARDLWRRDHGSLRGYRDAIKEGRLRTWQTPDGWGVEWRGFGGGGEVDPIWRVNRYQERRGQVIHVDLVVYGWPSAARRTALQTTFLDRPLGAPPR